MQSLLRNIGRLLIIIVSYWPIASLRNSVKWDNLDVVLPYRYFLGKMWGNGEMPLWNPFQQMGYPIYADLQSPTWYPETIIVGLLGGYTNITIHFLMIFYSWIGSVGFSRLAVHYGLNKKWAFAAGLVYVLSGFWVGHGQALFVWVSAAWIPFLWWSYLRFLNKQNIGTFSAVVFFAYLQITGGYATLTIIFAYLALFLLIEKVFLLKRIREGLGHILKWHVFLLLTLLMVSSPLIFGLLEVSPFVDRLSGLSERYIFQHPFSLPSFVSFIFPWPIVKYDELFQTDISMRNAFIGVIAFIGFLIAWRRWFSREFRVLMFYGLFCILGALGDALPFRGWMSDFLPGMNLFRFPAYFMFFPISISILIGMKEWQRRHAESSRIKILLLFVGFLLAVIVLSWSRTKTEIIHDPDFYGLMLMSGIYSLFITIILSLLIFRRKERWILGLVVAEMMIHVLVMSNYTVYNPKDPALIKAHFSKMPSDFEIHENDLIGESTDGSMRLKPGFWRNTGIFASKPSKDGFSSFWFREINDTTNLEESPLLSERWISVDSSEVQIKSWTPKQMSLRFEDEISEVVIHQAFYPGWKALVDGREIEIEKSGAFQKISSENSFSSLEMRFTKPILLPLWISGLLIWLLSAIVAVKHRKSTR